MAHLTDPARLEAKARAAQELADTLSVRARAAEYARLFVQLVA